MKYLLLLLHNACIAFASTLLFVCCLFSCSNALICQLYMQIFLYVSTHVITFYFSILTVYFDVKCGNLSRLKLKTFHLQKIYSRWIQNRFLQFALNSTIISRAFFHRLTIVCAVMIVCDLSGCKKLFLWHDLCEVSAICIFTISRTFKAHRIVYHP